MNINTIKEVPIMNKYVAVLIETLHKKATRKDTYEFWKHTESRNSKRQF